MTFVSVCQGITIKNSKTNKIKGKFYLFTGKNRLYKGIIRLQKMLVFK
jgi:hypothetical protein